MTSPVSSLNGSMFGNSCLTYVWVSFKYCIRFTPGFEYPNVLLLECTRFCFIMHVNDKESMLKTEDEVLMKKNSVSPEMAQSRVGHFVTSSKHVIGFNGTTNSKEMESRKLEP